MLQITLMLRNYMLHDIVCMLFATLIVMNLRGLKTLQITIVRRTYKGLYA